MITKGKDLVEKIVNAVLRPFLSHQKKNALQLIDGTGYTRCHSSANLSP
jgi:hypothetical protein